MKIIINQPFGVGDILFLSPLIANLEADHIIWPVVDHYYWVKDYIIIPNMQFIKQSEFNINNYQGYNEVPFQHSHYMVPQAKDCMEAKYMLLEANPEMWRTLSFTRNKTKEEQLKQYLNIKPDDKFIFVNNNFAGPEFNYKIDIKLQTNLKIVHQEYIDGFSLLDWCGVLEQADEIHTVSTAVFFVIESLKLEKTPLHLYPRKPLDKDLSPIKTLISNKWICHE
jgi:hypothetical protein